MEKPIYQKIIDDMLRDINNGQLEVGMKIPSQRALTQKYGVNRSTIVHVIDILKSYGVLESKERKGIYVSKNKWNEYVSNNLNWQDYIGNSINQNNQYYIREINRCEFIPDMVRLGTGELSPKLIPNDAFHEIISKDLSRQLTSNYEAPKGNIQLRQQVKELVKKEGLSVV